MPYIVLIPCLQRRKYTLVTGHSKWIIAWYVLYTVQVRVSFRTNAHRSRPFERLINPIMS